MQKLAEEYVNSLLTEKDMIKLIELKKVIDNKYRHLIVKFKNLEVKYFEAKSISNYYPNFNDLQNEFKNAKAELYSKEEVIEYFKLERKIQAQINDDINELKEEISNKFTINEKNF